jgi:hypothetical protein
VALIYLTKGTGTGTGWPHQQKGGGPLGVTFRPVGTTAFFTNGVDLPLFDDALNGGKLAGISHRAT